MDAKNTAKIIFIEELKNFLEQHKTGTLNGPELRAQVHRLKGGAGMLQLLDTRTALVILETALKQNEPIDSAIFELKQSYEKLS